MIGQILILIIGGGLLFYAEYKYPLLSYLFTFLLFFWGLVAFTLTDKQMLFYIVGFLFFLIMKIWIGFPTQSKVSFTVSAVLGLSLFGIAWIMSSKQGQIMGVAPLAIDNVTTWQSWMTLQFAPLISGTLGRIENALWIAIMHILIKTNAIYALIPVVGPFMMLTLPYVLTCFTFGIFHVTAYALNWWVIIWAMVMMGLMIASYYLTHEDMTAMDLFHFAWNGLLTTKESLTIAL